MKETLEKSLTEIINLTKQGLVKTVEIIQIEFPEIVSQLISLKLVNYILGILFGIVILSILFKLHIFYKKNNWYKDNDSDLKIECIVATWLIGSVVGLCFTITNILRIIKITIAPKIFLLEYIKSLIN